MSFGSITAQSKTYNEADEGRYVLSTLAFGAPDDSFTVRGANPSQDPLRCSVSRTLQKDVVSGSDTVRKRVTATLNIVVPAAGFTATEIDSLVADLNEFISVSNLTALLMGKS